MRKSDFLIICSGIPIAICLALFFDSRFSIFLDQKTYLLLFFSYGGIVSFEEIDLFSALLFCIPFMFQVLLFSNDLHRDFDIALVYIFTRNDTRNKWFFNKCFLLELKSWLYYIIQFLSIVVFSIIRGYILDFISIVTVMFFLFVSLINMNTLWMLLVCIVSIKRSRPLIVSGMLAAYIGGIFLLPILRYLPKVFEVILLSRSLLTIHVLPRFFDGINIGTPITLTIFSTCLLGIIARIILYFLSIRWIKDIDLI